MGSNSFVEPGPINAVVPFGMVFDVFESSDKKPLVNPDDSLIQVALILDLELGNELGPPPSPLSCR